METIDNALFVEKYRPTKIDDCVLPDETKKIMKKFVEEGDVSVNLLLSGPSGTGKTTVAKAMLTELGADYMMINASLDRNIDVLRTTIIDFASKVSMFGGKRKYIILDEADAMNPTSLQPALRSAMEDLSSNCGFILTVNHLNKIIDPLQGRCSLIEFRNPKGAERKKLIVEAFKRFSQILNNENIPFSKQALVIHIEKFFPNLRKALNEIQMYSKINGSIDEGILSVASVATIDELIKYLKEKQFSNMRKWVAENPDVSLEDIMDVFAKKTDDYVVASSQPQLLLHLNQYDYRNQFVINKEINFAAMLTEIMRDVEFK